MKLKELKESGYNLFEVFDTKCDITWVQNGSESEGFFEIDDEKYKIFYHEHQMLVSNKSISVTEVGFAWYDGKEYTAGLSGLHKHPSKVLGCVRNSVIPKLRIDSPDAILIAVQDRFGNTEKRKELYIKFLILIQKLCDYPNSTPFYRVGNTEFSYINKEINLSKEEYKLFKDQLTKFETQKIEAGI